MLWPDAGATTPKAVERSLVLGTGEALPLPDKPSIAVLAFTNMGGDPEQEFFSDGIAEDIITELSRSRSLFVIARNSSFTYKGHAVDVRQVGRELGVRYVLEGSVRRSGSRVRVVAQLVEAETGNHVWAERYDRDVTRDLCRAGRDYRGDHQRRYFLHYPTPNNSVPCEDRRNISAPGRPISVVSGTWERIISADLAQAQHFFQRAFEIDPMFAPACTAMAMSYVYEGAAYASRPLIEAGEYG